jgi:hypothetical protein
MRLNMTAALRITRMALLMLGLLLTLPHTASAMAQISLQNNTKFWLDLYIDGNFGCGPVMPSGFCTSSVKAGPHNLEARKGNEVVAHEDNVNIGDGTSPTWTVTIMDPDEELIKKLNGTRYFFRSEKDALIQYEGTIEIRGTTLVWTTRIVWARADIAKSMATGTNGFPVRPVGTWSPPIQMQIVGREAHYHDAITDNTLTVSEDGTSIVVNSVSNQARKADTYYRQ